MHWRHALLHQSTVPFIMLNRDLSCSRGADELTHIRSAEASAQFGSSAEAALAPTSPERSESNGSQLEQPGSNPAGPSSPSSDSRTANGSSSMASGQSRHKHSAAEVSRRAPAVSDELELECTSIAFGGHVSRPASLLSASGSC